MPYKALISSRRLIAPPNLRTMDKRANKIKQLRSSGWTLKAIAVYFNISIGRVSQILKSIDN
jgi:DNA-binding CsgD family transcriptional regulator